MRYIIIYLRRSCHIKFVDLIAFFSLVPSEKPQVIRNRNQFIKEGRGKYEVLSSNFHHMYA